MPEQEPSRFEAMKQGFIGAVETGLEHLQSGIDSLRQNTDRLQAVGLIGAVGIVGGGVAVANQLNTETASAENVPEATASDQTQDCVNEALKIKIKTGAYTSMVYPGDRRKQTMGSEARLNPTSPDCLPLVTREVPKVFFKMQRPKNHKVWTKTKAQELVNSSDDDQPIGDTGGLGDVGVIASGQSRPGVIKAPHFLYRCTPGKGVTRVKAVYKMKVDSAVDGHTLGRKTYSKPVKIYPVLKHNTVQGGGVRHAC